MFSNIRAESKHLYKKESLCCLCSLFYLFWSAFSFLKPVVYFFSLRTVYLASFVYTLYIEAKIYNSFLFLNTDVSQVTFPVSFVQWSTGFSNFVAFFLLLWFHVKSHESHEVAYATLLSLHRAVSELRRPCGKWLESLERRMRCFQKGTSSKGNPFSIYFFKIQNIRSKTCETNC